MSFAPLRPEIPVSALHAGQHVCFTYDTDLEHANVLAAFVRQGIERNERVLYFTDQRPVEDITRRLQRCGVDLDESGQVVIDTANASYLASGRFDPDTTIAGWERTARAAVVDGYSGLRVAGDMSWVTRGVEGGERWLEYEQRLDAEVFNVHPILGMCEFDLRRFRNGAAGAALGLHPQGSVAPDPLWKGNGAQLLTLFSPPGARLIGDLDVFTSNGFACALQELCRRSPADVYLDLSDVRYMDAASLAAIARIGARIAPQQTVVLSNVSAFMRRVIQILHLDNTPGIRIV